MLTGLSVSSFVNIISSKAFDVFIDGLLCFLLSHNCPDVSMCIYLFYSDINLVGW